MDQSFVLSDTNRFNHIDPRIKLLHAIIAGIMLFITRSDYGVLLNVTLMAVVLMFLGLYRCTIKMLACSIGLYVLRILLSAFSGFLASFVGVTVFILFKFTPVMGVYFMMTQSVSASELVSALERLRLPRAVTVTFAVTLRFMPTIGIEMRAIKDSMKIRNIPLTFWNIIKAPISMMEYVLVPMMMRFVKVGEELAASAVVRGIESPGERGALMEIKFRAQDLIYLLAVGTFYLFITYFERCMI